MRFLPTAVLSRFFALPGGCVALVLIVMSSAVFGQEAKPFNRYSNKTHWWMSSGSAMFAGATFLLQRQVEGLSASELQRLESTNLQGLAAWPAGRYDLRAARQSDWSAAISAGLPALVLLLPDARADVGRGLQMYAQVGFLNYALTGLTKRFVLRPRPYAYNASLPLALRQAPDARFSFYSGHTSTAASGAFFAASMIQFYSDSRPLKTIAWVGAAMFPLVTGYLRMRAGKHFFSDVAVGYLAGAMVGVGVPLLHRSSR